MVESCPKLQEIGLFGVLGVRPPSPANNLQSLELTPRNSLALLGANKFANTCGERSISLS